jgi:ATP-binding cassette subfamily B protein
VDRFPDGFETRIGERGVTLSGGQRQRTALSRALAREARVVVLDDAFSSVDTQTESAILARLIPALRERGQTALIISHRMSALRLTDRVVVVQAGRIAQTGAPAELKEVPGYYRDLCIRQTLEEKLEAV